MANKHLCSDRFWLLPLPFVVFVQASKGRPALPHTTAITPCWGLAAQATGRHNKSTRAWQLHSRSTGSFSSVWATHRQGGAAHTQQVSKMSSATLTSTLLACEAPQEGRSLTCMASSMHAACHQSPTALLGISTGAWIVDQRCCGARGAEQH